MNLLKLGLARLRGSIGATALALVACLAAVGCGGTPAGHSPSTPTPATSGVTVSTASIPGLGMVLVNGQGRTLYTLTSEQGGAITCSSSSGCTQTWPELDLTPSQASAHAGGSAQSSKLGTETGAAAGELVTYGGWPLYTYSGDSGPGQAKGQGLSSYGGTWYAVSASGALVKSSVSSASPSSGGSGGYGY